MNVMPEVKIPYRLSTSPSTPALLVVNLLDRPGLLNRARLPDPLRSPVPPKMRANVDNHRLTLDWLRGSECTTRRPFAPQA